MRFAVIFCIKNCIFPSIKYRFFVYCFFGCFVVDLIRDIKARQKAGRKGKRCIRQLVKLDLIFGVRSQMYIRLKNQLGKFAPDSVLLVKFCRSCRSAFDCPSFLELLGSRQKHPETAQVAYWKIPKNATNALYCDFSLAYWTGFSILQNFSSILIYALSSILPWTPILRFFSSILCSDSLTFAHICSVSALICRWDKLYSSASQNRCMGVFVRFSHIAVISHAVFLPYQRIKNSPCKVCVPCKGFIQYGVGSLIRWLRLHGTIATLFLPLQSFAACSLSRRCV